MRKKVAVIGAGNVGATTAQRLAERDYCDIVMVDIVDGLSQGKGLDMLEAGPVVGYDTNLVGSNGYEETANSDLVIITSGIPRKPGMSRDDLLLTNKKIVQTVTEQVIAYSPGCMLLMVSNPLDAMVQLAYSVSGFSKERVFGMAGVLDTARFRTFIAQELDVSVQDVHALVLGGHGDTMVPLPRYTTISGIPVAQFMDTARLDSIIERTRRGGEEIVRLLKTGSAFYAPSAAIAEMVDAILLDKKRILPAAALLEGEYGIDGLFVGVPVKLGARGVEQVIEIDLSEDERKSLQRSADTVRELIQIMAI